MSYIQDSHCSLQVSATPNTAYTDNPVYWNKYERAAAGLPGDISHLASTCLSCSEPFLPEVAGQSFCSEECYTPPCSICHHALGSFPGDNDMTSGLHLCADCYWDAEEEFRKRRARARLDASSEEEEEDDDFYNRHPEDYYSGDEEEEDEDSPPTKQQMLETNGALNLRRQYKTGRHGSSSNAAAASSTPPPPPSPALTPQPEVRYIFPGEPDYNGYDRSLDDWEEEDSEGEDFTELKMKKQIAAK